MAEDGCIPEAALELVRCADCRTGPAPQDVAKTSQKASLGRWPRSHTQKRRRDAASLLRMEITKGRGRVRRTPAAPFLRQPEAGSARPPRCRPLVIKARHVA